MKQIINTGVKNLCLDPINIFSLRQKLLVELVTFALYKEKLMLPKLWWSSYFFKVTELQLPIEKLALFFFLLAIFILHSRESDVLLCFGR